MVYERMNGETDNELIYRVCQDKERIGSWQEVTDILNDLLGKNYTESKYRKQFQSFCQMFRASNLENVTTSEYEEKLRQREEDLRKERIKLQTLNMERSRIDRQEARQDLFYEYIANAIEALPLPEFVEWENNDDFGCKEYEYVLSIADIHYGAEFVGQSNSYSREVVKERFEYLTGEVLQFVKDNNVHNLHIVCLGDMIQGILRLSDLRLNDTSVVKAVVEISRLIANLLNVLSKYVDIKYYQIIGSNHSQMRNLGSKANELASEDLEYIIANYIKDLLINNTHVEVFLPEEGKNYIRFDVLGSDIVAVHGHQIKDIKKAVHDMSIFMDCNVDYVLCGHYHNDKEFTVGEGCTYDREVLCCPSFMGSDPYADRLMVGGKPAAKIYRFSDIYGHDMSYKIILD